MITFPNAKINLGLNILSRRVDGYHTIDSVMYPVPWCDILEIVPASGRMTTLTVTGHEVKCPTESNLVYRAYKLMCERYQIPPCDMHLHKVIPDGAGLGGGSADAAFAMRMLRDMYVPGVSDKELAGLAARLGADCPFFISNTPAAVSGTGTELADCAVNLHGLVIAIAKPVRSVSTAQAYSGVVPRIPALTATEIVSATPVTGWRGRLVNDFETSVFSALPECDALKRAMYDLGAIYAQMSGSGSAVFGIFDHDCRPESGLTDIAPQTTCFAGVLD